MTIEARVVDALRKEGLTLTCAESCTGGLLGARITRVPGASDVFRGGIIAYHDDLKVDHLGVDPNTIAKHTSVHRDITKQMAEGARQNMTSDIAIAITGWAGPTGKDIGRVHIAIAHWGAIETHDLHLPTQREQVREGATEEALHYLLDTIPRAAKTRI